MSVHKKEEEEEEKEDKEDKDGGNEEKEEDWREEQCWKMYKEQKESDVEILEKVCDCMAENVVELERATQLLHQFVKAYNHIIVVRTKYTRFSEMKRLRKVAEKYYDCESYLNGFIAKRRVLL